MKKFKNIIMDYGNVIFAIDFNRTQEALTQIGIQNVNEFFAHKGHHPVFDNFETGEISADQFREEIRRIAQDFSLTDTQIDAAWNSLLIGVPSATNHDVLLDLKNNYRTFLLSNNNEIHYNWILDYLQKEFNLKNYNGFFEKAYFSHLMGMRKPHAKIFEKVIADNNLDVHETLFIDDSPQHLAGAQKAGLNTLLMNVHPKELSTFLKENGLL
ncbi:HAD family hydrolase [Pedobacter sp.]|uniref:HAD family hydrolase n=1 Tax=Pedobacter sp. TaxID=1411316 RepID=UPI00396CCDE0